MDTSNTEKNAGNETIYFCKIELAGKKIEIESSNKHVLAICRGYLTCFEHPDFVICASREEILQDYQIKFKTDGIPETAENIATEYINAETNAIYRKIANAMLNYNTILMHGAAISVNNKCYIFTAPSGTGKTTHIRNWLECIPDTSVINGDKPLINVDNKYVYGTPWCGKEGLNTNAFSVLSGIIQLERDLTNSIRRVSFREMLPCLLQQVHIPKDSDGAKLVYQHIGKLASVPCYRLKCNMEPESAIVAYNGIKENEKEID